MRPHSKTFAAAAGLALWPMAGLAQQGPTFDCDDATSRTEFAICASEDLARLEREMVATYEVLADRVGRRTARQIADEQLAIRQACEGDPGCIARQLVDTMGVFESAGGFRVAGVAPEPPPVEFTAPTGEPEIAAEDILAALPPGFSPPGRALESSEEPEIAATDILAALPPNFSPPSRRDSVEEEVAAYEEPALAEDRLDAAEAPLPDDLGSFDLSEDDEEPTLSLESAELTSSEEITAPPLEGAFLALGEEDRIDLQSRLTNAGYYNGTADGGWSLSTEAALRRFFADAITAGQSIDSSTPDGASAALDYIASEEFAEAYLEETPALSSSGFQW